MATTGTPKRRRQEREDSEDEEEQQSQKEARIELGIVSQLKHKVPPDKVSQGMKIKKVSEGAIHPIGEETTNKEENRSNERVPTEGNAGEEDPRPEIISSSSQNVINREGEGPEIIKTSSQNHPT